MATSAEQLAGILTAVAPSMREHGVRRLAFDGIEIELGAAPAPAAALEPFAELTAEERHALRVRELYAHNRGR